MGLAAAGKGAVHKLRALILAAIVAAGVSAGHAADAIAHRNHLVGSRDPYLLMHASNPVDWYPWGPEALAKAKRENKVIFLSIGYSTCFWCHVAERLIYSNPTIAADMNEFFVNIKVDREERPDLDSVYMLATELLTGHGGWPNNVFLTPDLKPFYAGSYFPPQDTEGHPGFRTVIAAIHRAWDKQRADVVAQAGKVYAALQRMQPGKGQAAAASITPDRWAKFVVTDMAAHLDSRYGGLASDGPKFPREPLLGLMERAYERQGDPGALKVLTSTLDALLLGGVHDHLGGGFFRYSTEPTWSIPHFEKMLYNNAQLLQLYAEAYGLTKREIYRQVATETADYLLRDMRAPDGAFYTAQDAEVAGVEGASYIWTEREIQDILGTGSAEFLRTYSITPLPRPTGASGDAQGADSGGRQGVLRIQPDLASSAHLSGVEETVRRLAPLRQRLLAARSLRHQPFRDEKILTGQNGLAIKALAVAGTRLSRPDWTAAAARAGEAVWASGWSTNAQRLHHESFRGHPQLAAFADDYALLGSAFLALHTATSDHRWLDRAILLAEDVVRQFLRFDGRVATALPGSDLLVAPPESGDDVQPSATSAIVDFLAEIATATKSRAYRDEAARVLAAVAADVGQRPSAWPSLIAAAISRDDEPGNMTISPLVTGPQTTSDVVSVSATRRDSPDRTEFVVHLKIASGYHVNANPASLDGLIPTTVRIDGKKSAQVQYPTGTLFHPTFTADSIRVYEGTVELHGTLPVSSATGSSISGHLKVQACDQTACLLPSDVPFTAPASSP